MQFPPERDNQQERNPHFPPLPASVPTNMMSERSESDAPEGGRFHLLIPNNDKEEAVIHISDIVADDNTGSYEVSIYPDGFTIVSFQSYKGRKFYRAETLQRALEKAKTGGMPNDVWFRVMRSIRQNFDTYRERLEQMASVAQAKLPEAEES